MGVKLISLFAIIRKELLRSGIQPGSSWAIVQPIEMIGSIKDPRRICGQQDVCYALESRRTNLSSYMAVTKKRVRPPADQDGTNQGEN